MMTSHRRERPTTDQACGAVIDERSAYSAVLYHRHHRAAQGRLLLPPCHLPAHHGRGDRPQHDSR